MQNFLQKILVINRLSIMAQPSRKKGVRPNRKSKIAGVVFLGTSSAQPVPLKRNVSSLVIQSSAGLLSMVDCGEGTQHQFKLSTLKIGKLRNIFITHLHGDHCYGLFGLIHSIRVEPEQEFTLNIYGPKGIKKMIETTLNLSGGFRNYTLNIQELEIRSDSNHDRNDDRNGDTTNSHESKKRKWNKDQGPPSKRRRINENDRIWTTKDVIDLGVIEPGIRCTACRITHRIATFGYVFEEETQSGKLDAAKAMALGAKGRQLGLLKEGHDVVLENGTTVFSKDVVGESISGRKMAVMQDCWDCSSCFKVAANCDLLVHESTFDEALKDHAIYKGHSTAKMAARNAVEIGAKMLMLTHFSSRFVEDGMAIKDLSHKKGNEGKQNDEGDREEEDEYLLRAHVERLQKEAEEVIAESNSECIVRCAADFMNIRFGKKGAITIDRELALTESKKGHFQHDVAYLKQVGTLTL